MNIQHIILGFILYTFTYSLLYLTDYFSSSEYFAIFSYLGKDESNLLSILPWDSKQNGN